MFIRFLLNNVWTKYFQNTRISTQNTVPNVFCREPPIYIICIPESESVWYYRFPTSQSLACRKINRTRHPFPTFDTNSCGKIYTPKYSIFTQRWMPACGKPKSTYDFVYITILDGCVVCLNDIFFVWRKSSNTKPMRRGARSCFANI